jgi:hypothetical protein
MKRALPALREEFVPEKAILARSTHASSLDLVDSLISRFTRALVYQ